MTNLVKNTLRYYSLAICILCGFAACTSIDLPALPQQAPMKWVHAVNSKDNTSITSASEKKIIEPDFQSWWTIFGDATLNQLVTLSLSNNLNLSQARERVLRTRILLGHSSDAFLPEIHAHTHSVDSADALNTFFQYGLDANWELGLFGRREGITRIAQAQMEATQAESQSILVTVVAEVVRTYIELRTHQQQSLILEQQQTITQQRLTFLKLRVHLGLSGHDEVAQAEQDCRSIKSTLFNSEQLIEEAAQRLALLLGQASPDSGWLIADAQPTLPTFVFTSLPADLLRARPDIRSAEASVLNAAGELGIARADMYPHVALGTAFYYSNNITRNRTLDADAIHSTPSIGPTIDIPLFDWGRRRAAMKAQNAELNTALLAYRQSVLEALGEGEMALSSLSWQAKLREQAETNYADQETNTQRIRVLQSLGFASELSKVDQEHRQIQAQLEILESRASQDLAFVALYKTFGGAPLPVQASN